MFDHLFTASRCVRAAAWPKKRWECLSCGYQTLDALTQGGGNAQLAIKTGGAAQVEDQGMGQHRPLWQFTLRGLTEVTLIVALALAYWQGARRIGMLSTVSAPAANAASLDLESDTLERYSITSGIAVAGNWHLKFGDRSLPQPTVTLELIRADDLQLITGMPASVSLNAAGGCICLGDIQANEQSNPESLVPGTYLVRAKCFDGQSLIGEGITAIEAVNSRAK